MPKFQCVSGYKCCTLKVDRRSDYNLNAVVNCEEGQRECQKEPWIKTLYHKMEKKCAGLVWIMKRSLYLDDISNFSCQRNVEICLNLHVCTRVAKSD